MNEPQPTSLEETLPFDENAVLMELTCALRAANAPVVLVGRGVNTSVTEGALSCLAALLPRLAFATTPGAKGAFPEDHPQAVGVFGFGGHPTARAALACADLILVVGTRLLEQSSEGWTKVLEGPHVFRFDLEATRLTAEWTTQRAVDGDLRTTLPALIQALGHAEPMPCNLEPTPSRVQPPFIAQYMGEPSADRHLKPQALMSALNRLAPDLSVCADAGNSMCWAIEWLQRTRARSFHVSLDWGSMGFALPAAIGVCVAQSAPVVALTGDGSMAMSGGELHTAVEHALAIIVIVLNDRSAGMVRMGMNLWFGQHDSVPGLNYRHGMDFARFACGFGALGVCVTDLASFEHAFTRALERQGPTVLDVHVDPDEVPSALSSRVDSLRERSKASSGGGMC